jgi:hypothetical protein
MKYKKIMGWMLAVTLSLSAADNAAIVEAIKANPALLDSPQAKAMMQKAQAPASTVPAKMETPVNDIVQEQKQMFLGNRTHRRKTVWILIRCIAPR